MPKRKIAIIGLGKISQDQHVPVIAASDAFELAAIVSTRGLGHGNVPVFKTPAELYRALPEIGVVAVNTPPGVRHAIAHEALAAGKDVLLEKPPATTLSELADLEEFAKAKGRVLFATWHSIFNPAVDEARDADRQGRPALAAHRVARGREEMASGPGLGVGAGRLRRVRSGHQCAVDPDAHPARHRLREERRPHLSREPADADRREARAVRRQRAPPSPPISTGAKRATRNGT